MRIRMILCVVLMLTVSLQIVADNHTLDEAEDAYVGGNYEAAIAFYELALLNEGGNGVVYANLAHSYYMNGQIGKAMLNYRRAEQYLPRNTIIESQIQQIEQERVDGIIDNSDWLIRTTRLTRDYLTMTELSIIVFVLWSVFFVGIVFSRNRQGVSIAVGIVGMAVMIMGSLLLTRLYIETERPSAVMIDEQVAVMSAPSNDFLTLFVLYEGIDLNVLENRDEWVRIQLVDGRQGWILESSLDYIPSRLG
ncbi:MAG: SH3 domain-containing protein [Chloroflexota bacterium]